MTLNYFQFYKKFKIFFSGYPEIKWKKHVSVVNDAYPGTFNLSFNEPEHLEVFKSYIDYPKSLFFGKIQPVIRHNDFLEKIALNVDSYKYLGLFDMGGFSLSFPNNKNIEEKAEKVIEFGFRFLVKELGLDSQKLFIKLNAGGKVCDLTNEKYKFNKEIPRDILSLNKWLKFGILKNNIIFDSSRDTLLALYLFERPSPWGYRNEILYDIGKNGKKNLLDIGTFEYCPWKPVITNRKIIDIVENKYFSILLGFGLERLLLLINRYNHLVECDHIFPIYNQIISDNGDPKKQNHKAFVLTEAVRVVHRVFSDSKRYSNLGKHRQRRLTDYLKSIFSITNELKISHERIQKYLILNAKLNPFYPELRENINLTNKEILNSFERKFL